MTRPNGLTISPAKKTLCITAGSLLCRLDAEHRHRNFAPAGPFKDDSTRSRR